MPYRQTGFRRTVAAGTAPPAAAAACAGALSGIDVCSANMVKILSSRPDAFYSLNPRERADILQPACTVKLHRAE